jgi:nitroreductase
MTIPEAIRTRRSIGMLTSETPTRDEIQPLLEAAVWAPIHRMTEPWRFHVLAGQAREQLGQAMSAALKATGETNTESLAQAVKKPLRAPVVIVVSCKPGDDEETTWENQWATAAAIQNMLLVGHESGLGTFWRTGSTMYSAQVAEHLGLDDGEKVIGAIYIGYSNSPEKSGHRTPSDDFTMWHGWDD